MAEAGTGFLEQLKSCVVWSWTYLWTVWFFIVLFLVYILRVPLKINDNLSTGKARRPGRGARPSPARKVSATRAGPWPAGLAAGGALGAAPGRAGPRSDARGPRPGTLCLGRRGRQEGVRGRPGAFPV
ncbi:Suppressor of tumorigenicity 7 protein [Galemys pyrenaicus]|uniref:Suppressor of tumorigenicity 7 protein n=1 Tax=Galemys pyrenaicus TaxID=202257 RepID=A0A8J6A3M9_GALPY|nr:Suppressor of tumorigenicity 7 protein [Galemys pyrenaicus]